MLWFIKKLRRKDFTQFLSDLSEMTCKKPAHLHGTKIPDLKERDVCPEAVKGVNECQLHLHDCHKFADCRDRHVGYVCSCQTGFTGNGTHCSDIDECKVRKCPAHSKCMNTLGSFSCVCDQGYYKRNFKCEDIDECQDGTATCHRDASCENTAGSYRCICKPGYIGINGENCQKQVLQTCRSSPSPCSGIMEVCIDGHPPGKFKCQCRSGYGRPNSFDDCEDIDECRTKIDPCDPIAECMNTDGSYKCVCPKGYSRHGHRCIDIDECANGEDDCHRDAICVNKIGSYACVCRAGFQQFKGGRLCLKEEEEEEELNMVPIIVGICVVVVLAIASLAFILYLREIRKRKRALEKKPLVKGKSKRKWLSDWMFPPQGHDNMNKISMNESALTIWSDSDEG